MKTRQIHLYVLGLLILSLSGCKIYSWTGVSIPPDIQSVTIERFENNAPIVIPSLGQSFTEQLRDKFLSQTNLKLVQMDGDYQLAGEITGYTIQPLTLQGNNTAAQNRLEITVRVSFVNSIRKEENWTETFKSFADFDANLTVSAVENDLIRQISGQLVQDIFNKTAANW